MDAPTLLEVEKLVIGRIASVGRVPVIDQIAAALQKTPKELAGLPEQLPAYAALLALKPKYVAQLAARLTAYPAHFPTLQSCANYIVDRAEIAEVEEELRILSTPPDDGPKVA
jgi:hypothetical protein